MTRFVGNYARGLMHQNHITNEYNLDLKMVMDVMSELKENKQIIEKLE